MKTPGLKKGQINSNSKIHMDRDSNPTTIGSNAFYSAQNRKNFDIYSTEKM